MCGGFFNLIDFEASNPTFTPSLTIKSLLVPFPSQAHADTESQPKQPWMMVRQLHKRLSVAGTVEKTNVVLFFFFYYLPRLQIQNDGIANKVHRVSVVVFGIHS